MTINKKNMTYMNLIANENNGIIPKPNKQL